MAYGDKPKREKDDMGNKGRRSGKGPKPMKGQKKTKKSKLVDDMGNKGRGGKGPKPMNRAGRESAKQERKNLLTENPVVNRSKVKRFQGSTKKLGNTTAMSAMMSGNIEKGLSADLGTKLAKATLMPAPKMPKIIKQPLRQQIKPVGITPLKGKTLGEAKPFTPSKRDMELKDAHLGTPPQQSADPAKLTYKKAGGPVKPKDKKAKR